MMMKRAVKWYYRYPEETTCGGVVASGPITRIGSINSKREFIASFVNREHGPLVAAAPEMLEALRLARTSLIASWEATGGSHGDGLGLKTIKKLNKIIAKAEGKS